MIPLLRALQHVYTEEPARKNLLQLVGRGLGGRYHRPRQVAAQPQDRAHAQGDQQRLARLPRHPGRAAQERPQGPRQHLPPALPAHAAADGSRRQARR